MLPTILPLVVARMGFHTLGSEQLPTEITSEVEREFEDTYGLTPDEVLCVWSHMEVLKENTNGMPVMLVYLLWLLYYRRSGISIVRMKDVLNIDSSVEVIRFWIRTLENPFNLATIELH